MAAWLKATHAGFNYNGQYYFKVLILPYLPKGFISRFHPIKAQYTRTVSTFHVMCRRSFTSSLPYKQSIGHVIKDEMSGKMLLQS
jgi:hypothetical protein